MPLCIDRNNLEQDFRNLGMRPGMKLIVHSSLKSLGQVKGGPDAVIDAIQSVLTPEGTLLMPSFNHDQIYAQGGVFDVRRTPTLNGIIPDTFWRRPDVFRSLNPTHAFAAWGKNARRYVENHHRVEAMGRKSPLGMLHDEDGHCLLLGVGYESNTFHHFVETDLKAPCLSACGEVYPVIDETGARIEVATWGWREKTCPIDEPALYASKMERQKCHARGTVGQAPALLYRLKAGYPVIASLLQAGTGGHPPCRQCPIRPRTSAYSVSNPPQEVRP